MSDKERFREIAEDLARSHDETCAQENKHGDCSCGRDEEVNSIAEYLEKEYKRGWEDCIRINITF